MAQNPIQQFVRQFPLLARPLLSRGRALWDEMDENLMSTLQETQGITMYEQGNQLIVEAELPGLKPEDIQITYNKGLLSIRAEQEHTQQDGEEKDTQKKGGNNKRYFYRSQRSWAYTLSLPIQVDERHEPQATFKDGIMKIAFEKAQEGAVKHISVKKG